MNAPIRPVLSLDVDRVVIVGLNAVRRAPHLLASDNQPDAFQTAGVLLEGALVDPLVQDVQTLALVNRLLGNRNELRTPDGSRYRRIPFIFVAPSLPEEINHVAERHGVETLRSINLTLLTRLIGGRTGHGALLSYLFFDPEFAAGLIELGSADARRWLADHTGADGPWQLDFAEPASQL